MKRLLALAAVLAAAVSAPLASHQPLDAPKPLSRTVEKWQDMAVSELIGMAAALRGGGGGLAEPRRQAAALSGERARAGALEYTPGANLADRRFLPASELLGKPVNNRDGKRAGELEDIVLNLGTGELRHVVVELERAQRRIALPLHALAVPMLRGEPLRVKALL